MGAETYLHYILIKDLELLDTGSDPGIHRKSSQSEGKCFLSSYRTEALPSMRCVVQLFEDGDVDLDVSTKWDDRTRNQDGQARPTSSCAGRARSI